MRRDRSYATLPLGLRLRRFLTRAAWVLLVVLGALLTMLQLRERSLAGVRVNGQALPPTEDVDAALRQRAAQYLHESVTLHAGTYKTTRTRQALGATRGTTELAQRIRTLGHTGNPFQNLANLSRSLRGGWDFAWPVAVDRTTLANVVRDISRHIDQPPQAGTVGEDWSMEGVPGITLNVLDAVAHVENALRNGDRTLSLTVRQVPPPPPIELGAPDGALDDDHAEANSTGTYADAATLAAYQPEQWLPSRGNECDLGEKYQRFCQGPRRVAAPFGAAAQRAETLGLGTFKTVSHLITQPPLDTWVQAAGDGNGDASLLYPVRDGTLWRGFGFVRRGELRDMLHKGVDIGATRGTPIYAVNDGIVAYADNGVRGYGNLLVMIHPAGSVTNYAHCNAIYVFPGQRVTRGQIIGEVGDTGIARGVHLHFEYRRGGVPVDPADRFVAPDAESTQAQ